MRSQIFKQVTLAGEDFGKTAAGTSADILVYLRDHANNVLWASGTDVPADASTGYASGCLFIDRDIAAGTGSLYINKGTPVTAEFSLVTQAS